MDEINHNLPKLHSSHVRKELNTNIMDLKKKRKLQAELLDLPLPKHKCRGRSFSSPIVCPVDEDLHGEILDDELEPDSTTDSNSFAGDSNSVISVSGEAKSEPECEKACPCNHRYSSSAHWGGNSSRDNLYSLKSTAMMEPDISKDQPTLVAREHNAQLSQNLEEQLLEFENNLDFMFSGYGDETIQHSTDKELENMPYSSGMKPNNYVLSSGRWSVNQGNHRLVIKDAPSMQDRYHRLKQQDGPTFCPFAEQAKCTASEILWEDHPSQLIDDIANVSVHSPIV